MTDNFWKRTDQVSRWRQEKARAAKRAAAKKSPSDWPQKAIGVAIALFAVIGVVATGGFVGDQIVAWEERKLLAEIKDASQHDPSYSYYITPSWSSVQGATSSTHSGYPGYGYYCNSNGECQLYAYDDVNLGCTAEFEDQITGDVHVEYYDRNDDGECVYVDIDDLNTDPIA